MCRMPIIDKVAIERRSMRLSFLYWQLRCRRLAPVDRWLCVPTFRLVCPFQSLLDVPFLQIFVLLS